MTDAPLGSWLGAVRRRWTLFRLVECASLGLTAGLLTLGAAVLSGHGPLEGSALAAASVSALACAGTWLYEKWRSPRALARRIDAHLGRGGAWVAAWELEGAGAPPEGLGHLLLERERSDSAARPPLAAARPPRAVFAALPLFAAAVLVSLPVPERAASRGDPAALARRAERVVAALGVEAGGEVGGSSEAEGPVAELERAARALAESVASGADDPELTERSERVERALARIEEASADDPAVRRALAAAGEPPPDALAGLEAPDRPGTSGQGMTPGPGERTMSGSIPGTSASPGGSLPPTPVDDPAAPRASGGPEAGTLAGRWWSARDDAVVAAFRDALRNDESTPR